MLFRSRRNRGRKRRGRHDGRSPYGPFIKTKNRERGWETRSFRRRLQCASQMVQEVLGTEARKNAPLLCVWPMCSQNGSVGYAQLLTVKWHAECPCRSSLPMARSKMCGMFCFVPSCHTIIVMSRRATGHILLSSISSFASLSYPSMFLWLL